EGSSSNARTQHASASSLPLLSLLESARPLLTHAVDEAGFNSTARSQHSIASWCRPNVDKAMLLFARSTTVSSRPVRADGAGSPVIERYISDSVCRIDSKVSGR